MGVSKYYVVDERVLVSCGLNMLGSDDWMRMSWIIVWIIWFVFGIICVFLLFKVIFFIWW